MAQLNKKAMLNKKYIILYTIFGAHVVEPSKLLELDDNPKTGSQFGLLQLLSPL